MENFIFKHILKLGWLLNIGFTLLVAAGFKNDFNDSIFTLAIRLFLFGFVWWLIFTASDEYAINYRKKIALRDPSIWKAYIRGKTEELDELRKGKRDFKI